MSKAAQYSYPIPADVRFVTGDKKSHIREGRRGRPAGVWAELRKPPTDKMFSRILHILFLDRPLTITERNSLLCRPFFILLLTFVVILVVCLN